MKELVQALKERQAYRVAFLRQNIRSQNAVRAFVRRFLDWKPTLNEKAREKINAKAAEYVKEIESTPALWKRLDEGKSLPRGLKPVAGAVRFVIQMHTARLPIDISRAAVEDDMRRLARQLPFWPWCETVKGIDALLVGEIVGEFGNPDHYTSPSKLWKRFGLAPFDGHSGATWRKESQRKAAGLRALSAEQWESVGYSPRRRSIIWNVGASLIRQTGAYYDLYLRRKEYEASRNGLTKMQIHRRAQRYMEKRFLLDLWCAWKASENSGAGGQTTSETQRKEAPAPEASIPEKPRR